MLKISLFFVVTVQKKNRLGVFDLKLKVILESINKKPQQVNMKVKEQYCSFSIYFCQNSKENMFA